MAQAKKPARRRTTKKRPAKSKLKLVGYEGVLDDLVDLLVEARRAAARSVNAAMTATYWLIGRRVVEEEQQGKARARYGEALMARLAEDLTARFGRGFSQRGLFKMRAFYLAYLEISPTVSAKLETLPKPPTPSAKSDSPTASWSAELPAVARCFPLPWSHYVRLLSVENPEARRFYEEQALRGGWSVRQLGRQVSSQFYERTLLSKNRAAMLRRGAKPKAGDLVTPEEALKDPYVLEFLELKDEYSESDLEAALIGKLESFLLELGGDFAFIGRQRRLRIGDEWYRIDLLFFHRRLRCLVVIDLKLGKFSHADAGQMHLYLNYAREHWTLPEENPPVGLILCAQRDDAVARYALDGLPNKVLAAEYRMVLPDERALVEELNRTRRMLEARREP